jgi:cupin fold WbuC family metalloprotein
MHLIKSKDGTLLHMLHRAAEIQAGRKDLVGNVEFLQVAALKLEKGKTFTPHKHIHLPRETTITQESWVVLSGRVKVIYYDLDDTIIAEEVLGPGDLSITLRGGHNYVSLDEGTIVYEFKTGPYFGPTQDKVFI